MWRLDRVRLPAEFLEYGGETGERLRAFDWSKTALGAADDWPQSLKTAVSVCMNSRFPILIWWGQELIKIYNDAYVHILGGKHPAAFGAPGRSVWPEIWDTIGPMLAGVMERGEANLAEDLYLPVERNGYPEECYFTFSYSPIRDETGGVGGIFTPVVETTETVIAVRRMGTLRDLAAARPRGEVTAAEACKVAARVCSDNPQDLPCVWIYLFHGGQSNQGGVAAHVGVLAGRTAGSAEIEPLPTAIDLHSGRWSVLNCVLTGQDCVHSLKGFGFPAVPASPWGDAVEEVMALPLKGLQASEPLGFIIVAINPRKRLDTTYRSFVREVATAISITVREAQSQERESRLRKETDTQRTRIWELFQQVPAGIAALSGLQHRFTFVNDFYVAMVQRDHYRDLLGKTVREALPELSDRPFFDWLDRVYTTGERFSGLEVPLKLRQPETGEVTDIWVNFVYQPTRNAAGEVDGVLAHVVDVTEQVLSRMEVESREQQVRALADSIPQLAWMADPDGNIFWYNQRWYEYTGKTEQEMIGWGWTSVHDPARVDEVVERYRHSMLTGKNFDMVFPLRGANGVMRDFLTRAVPVRDVSGQIVRWFGTNTDVDEQRRTQEALRQSEKLAAVGRLASSIAHEINNPLEAVVNLVYLAKTGIEDASKADSTEPEALAYLREAEHELARMAQITNHTLRFYKQQTAKAPADMAELLYSVLTLYRGRLSREGIEVKVDVRSAPPLTCFAGEIRQVVANLVSNALDAMPNRGQLLLRLRPSVDWRTGMCAVRITVADTGHGMPLEVRQRVYEAFFTTRGATGTGLGLWVSAGIVDSHGGSIQVRSKTACCSGTVFAVVLPYESDKPVSAHFDPRELAVPK